MKLAFIALIMSVFWQNCFAAKGIIVLSGGGAEGDIGVTTDWSYKLYKQLLANGDVTGDKKMKVVVVSSEQPATNFVINYFKSMGADISINLVIASKEDAFDRKKLQEMDDADALFIRGGRQDLYYRYWKDSLFHNKIDALMARGGSIGGTSSGSMVISEYTMTGGRDYYAPDVLQNSHNRNLRDIVRRKSSGIHDDFLNFIPNVVVDTHCGESARLGRMLGVHAKIADDYKNDKVLGICIEEHTGVVIKDNMAQIYGVGMVHFLQQTDKTKIIREPGTPLVYTDIKNDVLTDGWIYDLRAKAPVLSSMPSNTQSIPAYSIKRRPTTPFTITGGIKKSIEVITPKETSDLVIYPDAHSESLMTSKLRKLVYAQAGALNLLYNKPEMSAVLLNVGTYVVGDENADITAAKLEANSRVPETSLIVYDCSECTYKSLSPYFSNQDFNKKHSHSPTLINLRLHAIDSRARYNTQTRRTRVLQQDPHPRNIASRLQSK